MHYAYRKFSNKGTGRGGNTLGVLSLEKGHFHLPVAFSSCFQVLYRIRILKYYFWVRGRFYRGWRLYWRIYGRSEPGKFVSEFLARISDI